MNPLGSIGRHPPKGVQFPARRGVRRRAGNWPRERDNAEDPSLANPGAPSIGQAQKPTPPPPPPEGLVGGGLVGGGLVGAGLVGVGLVGAGLVGVGDVV